MSELSKLLTSVDAKAAIAEVAEFTVQEGKEAGFTAYKTPGKFIVSRVVRGARDYIGDSDELGASVWKDFGESTGPVGVLGETYNTICLDNVTCLPESDFEEDEQDIVPIVSKKWKNI